MHLLTWLGAAWHKRHIKTEREFAHAGAALLLLSFISTFLWSVYPAFGWSAVGSFVLYLVFGWLYDRTQP